jgi:hypothetical protein
MCRIPRLRFILVLCALLLWGAGPKPASADAIRCDVQSTEQERLDPFPTHFTPFRLGTFGQDLHYRDLEVMWDSLYAGGLNPSAVATLTNFIQTLDDSVSNPFGVLKPDFELIYEYFRRNAPAYDEGNAADTLSVVLGNTADVNSYNPSDRCHSDLYLFEKTGRDAILQGEGLNKTPDGRYPSRFETPDEDVSTGHAVDYAAVRFGNSVMVMGPPTASPYDLDGSGWTKPDQIRNTGFCHEFQHSIPGSSGLYSEFYSALAEAVGGTQDQTASGEVPYVWPLVGYGGGSPPTCSDLLTVDTNYKERTAFAAYLVYNFRGQDTTATLAAFQDDLAHKWAVSSTSLIGLRDLLADSSCWDCAHKIYFHPGGVAMDTVGRLALLLHNWRVANYVNNSFLDEHQYGYPPQLGAFSPARHLGAWQSTDGCAQDDIIAIPPEVVLSSAQAVRETTFVGNRWQGPYSFPMALEPLGSEYWVLRCDPSAWTAGQDLVVRVTPEWIYRTEREACHYNPVLSFCSIAADTDGRLVASVMPYLPPDGSVLTGQLWQHPEWAANPIAPTWTALDSAAVALEYVVPGFGSTAKAALVTLSLADGPVQAISSGSGINQYIGALPYRVSFALRKGSYQAQNPWPQLASGSAWDEDAAWAPSGDSIVFTRRVSGVGKIWLKALAGSSPQQMLAGSPSGDDQSKPDWSPRGDYVLFTLKPSGSTLQDLWVYNRRLATDLRKLTPNSGASVEGTFQPNGQGVAYIRHVTSPEELWELNRINLDGTGYTLLAVRYEGASLKSPRWSPDGLWVYFTSNDTLYAVGADGDNRGVVVLRSSIAPTATTFDLPTGRGPLVLEQVGQYTTPRTCIPDFQGHMCPDCPNPPPVTRDFRRVALTDTLRHDTQARFYVTSASFYGPRWSPEGTRVVYATNQNLITDRDIYVGQTSFDHAPTWTNPLGQLADQSIPDSIGWSQAINATDADGEPMTFVGADLPSGASVVTDNPSTGAGRFIWPNPGPVGATYYFALRVLDPSGGVASKVVKYTIVPHGGGGGCPFADTKTASGWQTENSILGRSPDASLSLDAYRLKNAPAVTGNQVTLRLRENEAELTTLDRVRLAVVDHATGTELFPDGEQPRVGTRQAAYRVTTARGVDVTNQVNGSTGGSGYQGMPGDTLYVQMSAPGVVGSYAMNSTTGGGGGDGLLGGDEKNIYLRYDPNSALASMSSTDASPAMTADQATLTQTGIQVQASDGAGGWRDVRRYYPRAYASETVLDSLGGSDLRLIFVGKHHLGFVGRIVPAAGSPTVTVLSPTAALHNRLGNVRSALLASGTTVQLATGDTLTLSFTVPASTANTVRDYALLTDGVYTTPATPARLTPQSAQLPVRFALGQNVPNPFSGTTTIQFELPQSSRVRIEVFDLLGRRIRTLTDVEWPAGYHAVEWDRRDDGGRELHSGVLVYRMTAGSFRDQRKMVITPR